MTDEEVVTLSELEQCLTRLEEVFEENRSRLGELDSVIGDGDHGESMARGFKTASETIEDRRFDDPAELFNAVGRALVKGIGGAAGPIFGSLFLGMAEDAKKEELTLSDLSRSLADGLEKVKKRGKAKPGDKTMVDALQPAVGALKEAAEEGTRICPALTEATERAREGMKKTEGMKSKKGRSSFSSERSEGHQDPGATSIYLIFEHFRSFFCDQERT